MDPAGISILVCVRDEAENVAPLHREIADVMQQIGGAWELLFVDDGSADETFENLRELHEKHPEVRVIRFARNFGKSAALTAGFAAVRGSVVITVDGDLQDDPREIPRLLEALQQGHDLVSGWKRTRRDPLSKRISSRLFNRTISLLTGVRLHDMNCGFKAYRAGVVRGLNLRHGLHRFIPVLAKAKGHRIGEIVVTHRPRVHGRSKYGWERVPQGLVDLHVVWLTVRGIKGPLAFFGAIGAAFAVPGMVLVGAAALMPLSVGAIIASMAVGFLLNVIGCYFLLIALLTHRAIAREPEGAVYSIAEQLG